MAYPKVTVVGAGNVGATTAELILLKGLADVTLVDVVDGVPQGKALDLMHMRSHEQFGPEVRGTSNYAETAGSDLVVVTAGVPRKPGMTREDLIDVNAGIVKAVLDAALPTSPDATFIFVTNPLDVMVNLAAHISGLPKSRLMGMGGALDTARYKYAIAKACQVEPSAVEAMVVGAHGQGMVPLVSNAKVAGKPLSEILSPEQITEVRAETVAGGGQVVELLKTGSAFYAPAASICQMVAAILQDTKGTISTCAKLEGEYGLDGLYMCVPCLLGAQGMEGVVELNLAPDELEQLKVAATSIKGQLEGLA
ncbi:MAG: malate dehydrogenase [Coriobacteriales bacterium]|jgi:malate dehydrogenase|nr:malate dehydrogenase [Coriobacteriales bacterium]